MKEYTINLTNMITGQLEQQNLEVTENNIKKIAEMIYCNTDLENEINSAICWYIKELIVNKE